MILTKGNKKEFYFESLLESKIFSGQLESLLVIVPTNRKARDLKKKIIDNYKDKPVSKIYIETLSTLSTDILKKHKSFIQLSEAAATVLIKESAEATPLKYFALYTKGIPFGTLDKIKNVISEYKKHGITPELLVHEAEKLDGGEKSKAIDIASIYSLYLSKCEKKSAMEIGDIYLALSNIENNYFNDYFSSCFPSVKTIVLEGFDVFTNLEINLLNNLSRVVEHELFINFDYYYGNEFLFSHLKESYNFLIDNGFNVIIDKTPESETRFQQLVREKLFNQDSTQPVNNYKEKLFISSDKNRVTEIENIAKTIKLSFYNDKISLEKICIAANNISSYSNIVRDIFAKYGIPINLTDRIHLKSSAPIVASLSLLELVEKDFQYRDLIRVLSNGFLHFDDIDINNLIFVGNELKITSGLVNWELALEDAISLQKFEHEQSSNDKLKTYYKAKKDIKNLSNLLSPFRKPNDYNEFINLFRNLLLKLKLPCKVLNNSNNKAEEFIKATTVFLQTLNEVLTLVNTETPNKKYYLAYYLDHIKTIANWARFNIKEKSDFGVLVTSVNEIRGLKFDYLFLIGMNDGDFPTKFSPEIFFSGSFKRKEKLHQSEERYHFYQTLSSWRKKLFLSTPKNDKDSELIESTYIKDLQKLFKITDLTKPGENEILSHQQLQIAFSNHSDNESLSDAINSSGLDSEKLKKSTEIKNWRIDDPFKFNEYSGFISSDEPSINNFLELFSKREFSVSQLETFAKCPFKYFAERVLKLKPIEEPSDETEPIELGNVLHSILYDFYKKVIKDNIVIGEIDTNEFNIAQKLLFDIAEDKISKLNLNSPLAFFEKEKILGIENNKRNSILFKFLRNESGSDDKIKPKLFEVGFGDFSGFDESKTQPLEIEQIKLRGKIDRIDVDEENKTFDVIDYKLKGRKPSLNDLWDGLSLQLPIYLLAGKQILKKLEVKEYSGNKMIIYSLDFKDKNFGPLQIKLSQKRKIDLKESEVLNNELISNSKEKIINYHKNIKNGSFHLSKLENREEKICQYCDFRSFCRMQEVFEI